MALARRQRSRRRRRRRRRRPSMDGSNARISSTTPPIAPASFHAGTIATTPRLSHAATPASSPTSSSSRRARCAYVCSSSTRSRARRPSSSAWPGSATSSRYAATASSVLSTTTSSLPGSNQRSIPRAGSRRWPRRGRELERSCRGRGGDGRVRPPCHVEIDARRRDRACERVERMSPIVRARARVALEVEPAEREVEVRRTARRLADHRLHPVAPELVAVAVEEDVDLLLDGCGAKNSGSAPQKSASARRAPSSSSRPIPPSSSRPRGRTPTGRRRGTG